MAAISKGGSTFSKKDLERIIRECASGLGYKFLKTKQLEAIMLFAQGKDTFVALPTGYGKSLIYAVLPLLFDVKRGFLIVLSPPDLYILLYFCR